MAFAAMPNDLFSRGMTDGLTENDVSFSLLVTPPGWLSGEHVKTHDLVVVNL